MPTPTVARLLIPLVVVAWTSIPALAQEWGDKMFDKLEIRFGSVARLADTTFKIKVKNPYVEEIQITSLTTSCGCISWLDSTKLPISIPSKQERELTIRLDTVRHSGDKRVTAFATVYEPGRGLTDSVSIPVQGRIRSDFEVRPSYVGFGPIDLGKSYTQRIGINYIGGRPDWKIIQAKTGNSHFTAQVVEKSRGGGNATYEALVVIDATAPAGVLRDQLILTTNEGNDANISIPIEATIEPDIVITDVQFGTVIPGRAKSMTVVVRGKKPFKIEKVDHVIQEVRAKPSPEGTIAPSSTVSLSDAISVKVPPTAAPVQVLTLTVNPPAEAGMFEEQFAVVIEGRPQPVTFKARGRIIGQEVTDVPKQ